MPFPVMRVPMDRRGVQCARFFGTDLIFIRLMRKRICRVRALGKVGGSDGSTIVLYVERKQHLPLQLSIESGSVGASLSS